MFQLFLRARAHNFLSSRREDKGFKARTIERDAETDRVRIDAVMVAIDTALRDAEREQVGLGRRVDDALARASVTFGNGTDEYLERGADRQSSSRSLCRRHLQRPAAAQGIGKHHHSFEIYQDRDAHALSEPEAAAAQ
ncbi:hypothetical protein ACVWZV_008525 [Bradyrhizobium sp. GM5.1]